MRANMDASTIADLLVNVGFAVSIAAFFVYRDSQRLSKMEDFQRDTLVQLVLEANKATTATANAIIALTDELKAHRIGEDK